MPWAAAAASAAGSIASSYLQAKSAKDAANMQRDATREANQMQWDALQQQREDAMPAMKARNSALEELQSLLLDGGKFSKPIEVGDVTQEAGYQFGLREGQSALNSQLAARGMRNSGAALKAAARFGNDYGTTKYDQAFTRMQAQRQATLNPLQSLAGLGQTGVAGLGQASQNYGNNVSNNALGLGNALAASSIARGSIYGNLANQMGGLASSMFGTMYKG